VIPEGSPPAAPDNKFEITATSKGSFVGRCAELCGTFHSEMNFEVRVVSPADYQTYLNTLRTLPPTSAKYATRQSIALSSMHEATLNKPYATTTYPFNTERTSRSATYRNGS
ncbi:MAG: hypothetical protein ACRDL8_15725, partial [Solirubrobacteraceae bacterium]